MTGMRRITEDDLARVFALDVRAEDIEVLVKRLARHPYVSQEDMGKLITIAIEMRSAGHIMRRFLNGRTDTQVVIEPGVGFTQAHDSAARGAKS